VVRVVPDPPRLHWGWVFGLSVITLGFFGQVWMIVQSVWVRKVFGRSKALPWTIAYALTLPVTFLLAIGIGVFGVLSHRDPAEIQSLSGILIIFMRIAIFVLYLVSVYTLRGELESSPIEIPLGGVMTFFFGPIYFQYHLFDYQVPDEVHMFRGPLRTELPQMAEPPRS